MTEGNLPHGQRIRALRFIGEMDGLQLDGLARLLNLRDLRSAGRLAASWAEHGYVKTERLSPGPDWVWLTEQGLEACSLRYKAKKPASRQHTRALAETRIAFEKAPLYIQGKASWRCERDIRSILGGGRGEHRPDAVVTWPAGTDVAWAGETWAIEMELSPKGPRATLAIMRQILTRTGEYGCPVTEVIEPGKRPLHARVLYFCGRAAVNVVTRRRAQLGPLAVRVEACTVPRYAPFPGILASAPHE